MTLPPNKSSTLHNTALTNGLLAHPPIPVHWQRLYPLPPSNNGELTNKTLKLTNVLCNLISAVINKSSTHPHYITRYAQTVPILLFFYKGCAKQNVTLTMSFSKSKRVLVYTSKHWEFDENLFRWQPEINLFDCHVLENSSRLRVSAHNKNSNS